MCDETGLECGALGACTKDTWKKCPDFENLKNCSNRGYCKGYNCKKTAAYSCKSHTCRTGKYCEYPDLCKHGTDTKCVSGMTTTTTTIPTTTTTAPTTTTKAPTTTPTTTGQSSTYVIFMLRLMHARWQSFTAFSSKVCPAVGDTFIFV